MRQNEIRPVGALQAMAAAKRALREVLDPRRRRRRKLRNIQVRGPLVEQDTLREESRIEAGW